MTDLHASWRNLAYNTGPSPLRWGAFFLRPASCLYGRLARLRRRMYTAGILPARRLSVPVISVGNLTVGGVGKTPCVIALVKMLQEAGYAPAVLLRGYKRRSAGPLVLRAETFSPDRVPEYGDEAALICHSTGRPVGIGPDRFETGSRLLKEVLCDVVLLDDGFQHYQLHRDVDLVLLDGTNPFGNGFPLPYGPLREPQSALHHASAIAVRDAAETNIPSLPARDIPTFSGRFHWRGLLRLDDWWARKDETLVHVADLSQRQVHLLSGIGDPGRLETQATERGLDVRRHHRFPDHHWFSAAEIRAAAASAADLPILLTEKDAVRLLPLLPTLSAGIDRFYVIKAEWIFDSPNDFESWILPRVDSFKNTGE